MPQMPLTRTYRRVKRPGKMDYAMSALGAARRVYGPINYRAAATKIQKAFRKYKKRKAPKRASTGKQRVNIPRYNIGPYIGPVPKLTGAKMPKGNVVKMHFEDFGDTTTDAVSSSTAYFGFQDTAGRAVYYELAAVVLRALAKKVGVVNTHAWDEPISNSVSTFSLYRFNFRRQNFQNGTTDTDTYDVAATNTLTDATSLLGNKLRDLAYEGYYMSEVILYRQRDGGNASFYVDKALAESIVDIRIKTKIRFQNVTLGDTNSVNRNAVDANPLKGRIYRFSKLCPIYRDGLMDAVGTRGRDLQDCQSENGVVRTTAFYDATTGHVTERMRQPQKGRAVFQNCTHEAYVELAPGGHRSLAFVFNFHGTIQRLMRDISINVNIPGSSGFGEFSNIPKLGGCYMIGLEPAIRTTLNEEVKVAWNREVDIAGSIRFGGAKSLPTKNTLGDNWNSSL